MFRRMNSAAVRTRAMPAPMLYDAGPHTGGAPAVPWPPSPWHFAHVVANTRAPAAVSAVDPAHCCNRAPAGGGPTGIPWERNARYATMSAMSRPAGSSAVPFMLRRKQSFTRYSIVSTDALRVRY